MIRQEMIFIFVRLLYQHPIFQSMHLLKVLWVQHCKASNGGKAHKKGTLQETQQTQGTDSVARFISTACFHLNFRDNSRYKVNTLGPLCLWQYLQNWSQAGAACICCKFGLQVALLWPPFASVVSLPTR